MADRNSRLSSRVSQVDFANSIKSAPTVKVGVLEKHSVSAPEMFKNWRSREIKLTTEGITWSKDTAIRGLPLGPRDSVSVVQSVKIEVKASGVKLVLRPPGGLSTPANKALAEEWRKAIAGVISNTGKDGDEGAMATPREAVEVADDLDQLPTPRVSQDEQQSSLPAAARLPAPAGDNEHAAAAVVQKHARGRVTRKRLDATKLAQKRKEHEQASIALQSAARRRAAKMTTRDLLEKKSEHAAAASMQAAARGRAARAALVKKDALAKSTATFAKQTGTAAASSLAADAAEAAARAARELEEATQAEAEARRVYVTSQADMKDMTRTSKGDEDDASISPRFVAAMMNYDWELAAELANSDSQVKDLEDMIARVDVMLMLKKQGQFEEALQYAIFQTEVDQITQLIEKKARGANVLFKCLSKCCRVSGPSDEFVAAIRAYDWHAAAQLAQTDEERLDIEDSIARVDVMLSLKREGRFDEALELAIMKAEVDDILTARRLAEAEHVKAPP